MEHETFQPAYLNLMAQYEPYYRATHYPPLDCPITQEEYRHALALADKHGLHRLDQRHYWDST